MPPMQSGQIERRIHDDKRHGTTTPFTALDIATGAVIGKCCPKQRYSEFRNFLNEIETSVPDDLDIHKFIEVHNHNPKPF